MVRKTVPLHLHFNNPGTWKRFGWYFTVAVVLGLCVTVALDYLRYKDELQQVLQQQEARLDAAKTTLARDLAQAVTDIQVLLESVSIMAYAEDPAAEQLDALTKRFGALISYSGIYEQGRFFDATGREVLRVTLKDSEVSALTETELDDAHQYCVDQALNGQAGSFYIAATPSPEDLASQPTPDNLVSQSSPPSICLSSPIYSESGDLAGAVIFHYPRAELFHGVERALNETYGSPMLVNSGGYLMYGTGDRWVPYHLVQERLAIESEHARIWGAIKNRESGTASLENELFLFLTLRPQDMVQEAFQHAIGKDNVVVKDKVWKLLSQLDARHATYLPLHRLYERGHWLLPFIAILAVVSLGAADARMHILTQRAFLKRSESRLRTILDSTRTLAYFKDLTGRYLFVNSRLQKVLGENEKDILGRTDQELASAVGEALFDDNQKIVQLGQPTTEEKQVTVDDEPHTYHSHMVPLRNGEGEIYGSCGIATDITQLRRAEERLVHLAHHDPLTGLPNRLLFREKLTQALAEAKRNHSKLAVLFLDLDRFKLINDTQGHHIGDLLLKNVSDRIRKCVREEDTVARMGGDEFTILLNRIEKPEGAIHVAQKILHAVGQPMRLEGRFEVQVEGLQEGSLLSVGVSVGIALYPEDAQSVDGLAMAADAAMYLAKQQGRRTYAFYSQDLAALAHRHLRIERELRRALDQKELVLFYQPQISLGTEQMVGAEALLRWQHPLEGLLLPAELIDVAEQSGVIHELGEWVICEACRQVGEWQRQGLAMGPIAVNVSGHQIASGNLGRIIRRAFASAGLKDGVPGIEIEITESVLQHPECAGRVLEELEQMGVKTAIDDFGTGYSSLHQLKKLSVNKLKVAGVFMEGIPENPEDSAIGSAVVSLGHSLHLPVVAEGVENEAQVAFLQHLGCEIAQGYYFGRPMPAAEFREFYLARIA